MFRFILSIFLLAFMIWWSDAPLSLAIAEGPMLANQEETKASSIKSPKIFYHAKWFTNFMHLYAQVSGNTQDDPEGLMQIFARGPTLAEPDSVNGAVPSGPDDLNLLKGPLLAQLDRMKGPVLSESESPEGPMLLAQNPSLYGPRVDAEEEPVSTEPMPANMEALYRELRELRQDVDKLRQEAEARESLKITEEESRDEEEEILEAAGREYSLMRTGMFGMDLSVSYTYNSYDVIRDLYRQQGTRLEYHTDHTINNALSLEFPRRDNLTLSATIPFVYKYDKVATAQSKEVNDLGDISLGIKYQPLKAGNDWPSPIISASYTFPTGRGAYDIDPNRELATGSGLHSVGGGISISQPFDPVNTFGSLSYSHSFTRDNIGQRLASGTLEKVEPGDMISASVGFGYALAYRVSLSLGLSYTYGFPTTYYWANGDRLKTGVSVSSSLSLNTAWRISRSRRIVAGISKGLTTDSSDFSFSLRLPIEFDLR